MAKIALVTGGAGFIGSRLIPLLLNAGYFVRILDNLSPQVHGHLPEHLNWLHNKKIDFIRESITSINALEYSLRGVHTVIHLAAETGTGQSMYEISKYFQNNVQGTANILDVLQKSKGVKSLQSLIVASSRAIYGEGSYKCREHGLVFPTARSDTNMANGDFEPHCPFCNHVVSCVATDESAPACPSSIYAFTKQIQEQAILLFARTNGLNGFALRYQNVFGFGQSLKNPYTGILSIFSNLARQGQPIDIFEDGLQSRDFVFIDDAVEATMRAVLHKGSFVGALNVGTGVNVPVMTVANEINSFFGSKSQVKVTHAFRGGDIRHNKATTNLLESILKFKPTVPFSVGLQKFLQWVESQPLEDTEHYRSTLSELQHHHLLGTVTK